MTYEYVCTDAECRHEWEEEAPITSDPRADCPKCKKQTAQRLVSGGTGFSLKGARWARDSYHG